MPESGVFVVGSGPNGLAAAIVMARAGLPVTVVEAASTVGGGTRSAELTLPGFIHDICSAIHPLAAFSPFFKSLPLADHGLKWITPPAALAHPLDDGTAAVLEKEIFRTVDTLDFPDRRPYLELMAPIREHWQEISSQILGPLALPAHPLLMARFGIQGLKSAASLARNSFSGPLARALFAGMAAHSFLPLDKPGSAAFGLVLGTLGHVNGWPMATGGSGKISQALASHLLSLGGKVITGKRIDNVDELPDGATILLDLSPRQVLQAARQRLDGEYRRHLEKYRFGPGIFKVDWALNGPIPWRAAGCRRAATLHLGGTMEEIAAAEKEVSLGRHSEHPFVLVAQQSLFDPSRAPAGKQVGWAYCHVPNGSRFDMTERIERQVERFAPGFRELIIGRHTRDTAAMQSYNENFIGGDINGGLQDLRQMIVRPVAGPHPYATSDPDIFICSASTPPGGGVHGLCGYHAARLALARMK
jgi:phytoene dehydrogenase-like protein